MKKYAIALLISGGQTGVDRAALDFALALKIPCTGWCPKGRKAEDGVIPEKYPLLETSSELYQHRTRKNVKDADATLIISDAKRSRGTDLTIKCAGLYMKPVFIINSCSQQEIEKLKIWLHDTAPLILNVAGPRGSESSAVYQLAMKILKGSLKKSKENAPAWPPPSPFTPGLFT